MECKLESDEELECDEPGVFIDVIHDNRYHKCVLESVSKGTFKRENYKCPKYHVFSMADERCVALIR